ncbi:hypothetical protein DR950_41835 [Kitasatospora xanthocidica]|uniref:Uncharacterized protein n=1 Tax=Kitasatospora xanthocidica TaxID=83382 RepID=A0A372ZJG7_9ACTN|nr:hypothetical protein [Kitasatospora xanthocidica]RGD55407.1 hypothetical protein DR950_41835 [Kitasatospora xanthocidica]
MGRQKPGKPRRERQEPQEHEHEGFEIPDDYRDPGGRPVDHKLLGQLLGAAMDGCLSCQDVLTTLLVEDPVTTARLVELACVSVHGAMGGLPGAMTDDGVPGPAAPEFRRLARLGLDGGNAEMFAACEGMSTTGRREAANTALDFLVAAVSGVMGPV